MAPRNQPPAGSSRLAARKPAPPYRAQRLAPAEKVSPISVRGNELGCIALFIDISLAPDGFVEQTALVVGGAGSRSYRSRLSHGLVVRLQSREKSAPLHSGAAVKTGRFLRGLSDHPRPNK